MFDTSDVESVYLPRRPAKTEPIELKELIEFDDTLDEYLIEETPEPAGPRFPRMRTAKGTTPPGMRCGSDCGMFEVVTDGIPYRIIED